MLKLRKLLTEQGIDWHDASTPPDYPLIKIDRTHFEYRGYNWSVINGFGSLGGYDLIRKKNTGLLEVMSAAVNDGEPIGYLKAKDVMRFILEGEK